ncbi:MAG TPA: cadherin-like domain-containing protein [Gemmataceae bacterium]|jgi:hypothetical protein|nr:cadherin-like domain-containing protein [Gemmataceae bacterium]
MLSSLLGNVKKRPARRRPPLTLTNFESRINPDGTLLVSSYFDGAVYKVNATTGAIRQTIVAPYDLTSSLTGPAGLTVGPDGNLYISSQANDKILEYNLSTNTMSTFIDSNVLTPIAQSLGNSVFAPAGLTFGPDGDLYVSLNAGQSQTGPSAVVHFGVSSAGGVQFFDGGVTLLAYNLIQTTGLIFGNTPADANTLYVSNYGVDGSFNPIGGQVSKIDNATTAPNGMFATTFVPAMGSGINFASGLAWGPNGDLLVVDLGATASPPDPVGQVLKFTSGGLVDGVFTTTGALSFQFPSDIIGDGNGHFLTANLGPAYPEALQGSIFRFNNDGTSAGVLITSADFPDTGIYPGNGLPASGISPSEMAFIPNQSPTIALPGGSTTYTENQTNLFLDSTATVVDDDSPDFDIGTLTVSITANASASDRLTIINQGNGAGQIGVAGAVLNFGGVQIGNVSGGVGSDLVVIFNSSATPAIVQAVLRDITFSIASDNPTSGTRTVQVKLTDGDGGASNTASLNIGVTAVNDAPAVTTNNVIIVNEGSTTVLSQATLEATDPDNTPAQLIYQLTSGPAHGEIRKSGSMVTTFTQADINAGIITYFSNGDEVVSDSFGFTVSDSIATPVVSTFNITITPVNDAPILATNATLTTSEGPSIGIIDQSKLKLTDPDNTASQLVFSITAGPAHGYVRVSGSAVTSFTQAQVNSGIVEYINDGNEYTSDSFMFTFGDGTAAGGPAIFNINVTPGNDTPTVSTNTGLDVTNGSIKVLNHAVLATTDPDNTAAQLVYTVTSSPTHGTLQDQGVAATTFTQADIDAGRVRYVSDGAASPALSDSFTFSVSDGAASTNPATFAIAIDTLPVVNLQPIDHVGFAGTRATFTAGALGTPAPTVQWQTSVNGFPFVDIPGATAPTYSTDFTAAQNGNQFRAVFTNAAGSANSNAAQLTVTPGLAILANPVSQTAVYGSVATLTASATGSTKTSVQWQVSTDGGATYANIAKATKSTLNLKAVAGLDGHLYRAVFKNAAGTAASAAAEITVNVTVPATKKQTILVTPGTDVMLVAQSSTLPPTAYQWQASINGKTWADIAGETGSTLFYQSVLTSQTAFLRVQLTTAKGVITSAPTFLYVIDRPAISLAPAPVTVAAGGTATFQVGVTSSVPAKLVWQVSVDGGLTFTDVPGGKKSTLMLKKVAATFNGYLYRAVFTSDVGTTASTPVLLTVT